jgi:hypothetical protein
MTQSKSDAETGKTALSDRTFPFSFDAADGSKFYAAASQFTDGSGLSWTTIVAMSRSDFMGGVVGNLIQTGLLTIVAVRI